MFILFTYMFYTLQFLQYICQDPATLFDLDVKSFRWLCMTTDFLSFDHQVALSYILKYNEIAGGKLNYFLLKMSIYQGTGIH